EPFDVPGQPVKFLTAGGTTYFLVGPGGPAGDYATFLWKSDGTAGGTVQADLSSVDAFGGLFFGGGLDPVTPVGGNLFFVAPVLFRRPNCVGPLIGCYGLTSALFRYDGTTGFEVFQAAEYTQFSSLRAASGALLFNNDGSLWLINGTSGALITVAS